MPFLERMAKSAQDRLVRMYQGISEANEQLIDEETNQPFFSPLTNEIVSPNVPPITSKKPNSSRETLKTCQSETTST
jgi:hypothetical protein